MYKLLLFAFLLISFSAVAQQATLPFSISVSSEHPSVKLGEPIHIRVEMNNISNHDVDCTGVASNGLDRAYIYTVVGPDGKEHAAKPLAHPEIGETFSSWPCVVKPGTSARAAGGLISQIYSFEEPGQYTITVSRRLSDSSKTIVASEPLVITVEP